MVQPKSKYRIVLSFTYKGPKGKWKPNKFVRIGPGQELPELESREIERLLQEGKIREVSSSGELIVNTRFVEMNAERIDKMLSGKPELAIMNIIHSTDFSTDTLNRILVFCEQNQLKKATKLVDEKLQKLVTA